MPYTTEVIQSLPFKTTPVGQELIVGLSCDLCVAQELNVKFCFDIMLVGVVGVPIELGVFKTTPNNAGSGILDVSAIIDNYVSADNIASTDSTFKIEGDYGKQVPMHIIDKYSRSDNSIRAVEIEGYTEYTDSSGTIQTTSSIDVVSGFIINGYAKQNDLLKWTDTTTVGDAFGFGFSLEDYELVEGGSDGKFLTNSPSTLYAGLKDYGTLSFLILHASSLLLGVEYYKVTMYDSSASSLGNFDVERNEDNGAWSTLSSAGITGRVLYIGAFPANLRVNDTFNTQINNIAYYTIGLYDDDDTLISEVKRVDILCPNLKGYEQVRLTWLNQFGAWDYFTFNQKSVKAIATKGTTYQQLGGTWNSDNYEPYGYKGGKKTFRVNASETIKINTDYLTEEHSEWFEELINSPEIYILKDWESPREETAVQTGAIVKSMSQYATPVRLTTTSFTKKTVANDKLIQYTFEVEKSRNLRTQAI